MKEKNNKTEKKKKSINKHKRNIYYVHNVHKMNDTKKK